MDSDAFDESQDPDDTEISPATRGVMAVVAVVMLVGGLALVALTGWVFFKALAAFS